MAESRTGPVSVGYDEGFINPLDDDFTCLICQVALREPVLTRCGHRFCRGCLEQCFSRQNGQCCPNPCPVDREELVYEKDVVPDKATERKILSLAIKCPTEGSGWTGELREKQNHLLSCCYKAVSCTNQNCKVTVLRKDLDKHVGSLCPWRLMTCTYCNIPHPKCQEEEHYRECEKYQVECPHGCGAKMQQEKLSQHTGGECPHAQVQCPCQPMGCDVMVQREQLESHLDSSARRHLDLACVKLNANQEQFKETTRTLESKIEALEKQCKEKFQGFELQMQLTTNLGTKRDNEILKLKEESKPFVWKVEYFREMLKAAKSGLDTMLSSGIFFTGPNGYKLMLTLYPNGFGAGKNTHISVFLTILRGKYDAVLPWPFRKAVTFTLLDQGKNLMHRENYVKKLDCEQCNSDAFARPVTDCNDEYGFPKFISHQDFRRRRFIEDDTLFLQVQTGPPS